MHHGPAKLSTFASNILRPRQALNTETIVGVLFRFFVHSQPPCNRSHSRCSSRNFRKRRSPPSQLDVAATAHAGAAGTTTTAFGGPSPGGFGMSRGAGNWIACGTSAHPTTAEAQLPLAQPPCPHLDLMRINRPSALAIEARVNNATAAIRLFIDCSCE
jgi:hypothetical protein